jgi:urease accessory protein
MNALLLLLLDSRSPAGAHNHSGGMEAAVEAGFVSTVDDVRDFCRGRLRTSARVAAGFAAQACRRWPDGDWRSLHAELDARTPSEAMRTASYALGAGLRRLLRSMGADLRLLGDPVHHPIALGAGVALAGGTPRLAGRAAALATCSGAATAAVRLLGLDPYAVHAVLAGLAPEIDAVPVDGLPADSAPALDLLADVHATQEVRLFAS